MNNKLSDKIIKQLENETRDVIRVVVNKIHQVLLCDQNGDSFTRLLSIWDYAMEFGNGIYTAQSFRDNIIT